MNFLRSGMFLIVNPLGLGYFRRKAYPTRVVLLRKSARSAITYFHA